MGGIFQIFCSLASYIPVSVSFSISFINIYRQYFHLRERIWHVRVEVWQWKATHDTTSILIRRETQSNCHSKCYDLSIYISSKKNSILLLSHILRKGQINMALIWLWYDLNMTFLECFFYLFWKFWICCKYINQSVGCLASFPRQVMFEQWLQILTNIFNIFHSFLPFSLLNSEIRLT